MIEQIKKYNSNSHIGDKKAFLKDLRELSLKYRLTIQGCGCCESPYFTSLCQDVDFKDSGGYVLDNAGLSCQIHWVSESNEFDWKHYGKDIIK